MFEDTCKDGDSDAYKCVHVIVQIRQKRKGALLSHRKRQSTHIGLFFNGLKSVVLKLQCLKTRDHATDVVPRLVTSFSLCPGWWFCISFSPRDLRCSLHTTAARWSSRQSYSVRRAEICGVVYTQQQRDDPPDSRTVWEEQRSEV